VAAAFLEPICKQIRHLAFRQEADELRNLRLENGALRSQLQRQMDGVSQEKKLREEGVDWEVVRAQVVFRDLQSWGSSVWIDVGQEVNRVVGRILVGVNSPVVSDGALIGVVEYVGEGQSRVRLISDASLVPSVEAVQRGKSDRELYRALSLVELKARSDLFGTAAEQEAFLSTVRQLTAHLEKQGVDQPVARGEVRGGVYPYWRFRQLVLNGWGFHGLDRAPPLARGDLLITSGLDGVFPRGIPVGTVSSVAPTKDGTGAYKVEALPAAGDLDQLRTVLVLPPLSGAGVDKDPSSEGS
jgi:cell shape-determining protein MreC